jgi:sugar phosphate isomerase/epimerase
LNIAHWLGAPTPVEELIDAIGAISARADDRGLEIVVEFMPEGAIADLATAARIIAGVGSPNCGLMLDTWHLWRTGGTVAELAALPPGCIRAVQLSDALMDVRDTWRAPPTRDRLLPGDGEIPLVDIMRVLHDNCPDSLVGLEVLSRPFRELPSTDRAHAAFAALSRLLEATGSG